MSVLEQFLMALLPSGVALLEAEIKRMTPQQAATVKIAHTAQIAVVQTALTNAAVAK